MNKEVIVMHTCRKCHGVKHLIVGVLLLVNAFLWPKWLGIDGWISFFAALMVLGSLYHAFVPNKCKSCNLAMPTKKGKK